MFLYRLSSHYASGDILILNPCCFISDDISDNLVTVSQSYSYNCGGMSPMNIN